LILVVGAGLSTRLVLRPSPTSGQASVPVTVADQPAPPATVDLARLRGLLPSGYSPSSCKPENSLREVLAEVACAGNSDPDGLPSANYTVVRDKAALQAVFREILKGTRIVVCPGNIQSPGPWRRNANPREVAGTPACAQDNGQPLVVWTTDASLLLSVLQRR
jgi:hypothetical protein